MLQGGEPRLDFERIEVQSHVNGGFWGKVLADVDGDGQLDLVVGARYHNEIIAFIAPHWRRQVLRKGVQPGTGLAASDIDGDGRTDLVVATDHEVLLLRAPHWQPQVIGKASLHDVKLADVDGDGRLDIIGRGQSAFGNFPPDLHLYLNRIDGWRTVNVKAPPGEGLEVADLDGDGRLDVIINAVWFRNVGPLSDGTPDLRPLRYAPDWNWPHTTAAVGDIDGDGRLDIVLAPSELAGGYHRVSWFSQPVDARETWTEHAIVPRIETAQHGLQVADFDGDGRSDVFRRCSRGARPTKSRSISTVGGGPIGPRLS